MLGFIPNEYPTVRAVIEAVAKEWRVFVVDILSHGRSPHLTLPRHVAMYLAVRHTPHSLKEVGRAFDRDRSTVVYGSKNVAALMRRDAVFCRRVNALMDRLEAPRKVA